MKIIDLSHNYQGNYPLAGVVELQVDDFAEHGQVKAGDEVIEDF